MEDYKSDVVGRADVVEYFGCNHYGIGNHPSIGNSFLCSSRVRMVVGLD